MQTTRPVLQSSEGHDYQGVLANGHWIDAQHLQPGDRLLADDTSWAEVVAVRLENTPIQAYNLTVAGFHTYFVTEKPTTKPVWVHNNCLPEVNKVVNSKGPHAVDRAIERQLGFSSRAEANKALKDLKSDIGSNGWPKGTIMHANGKDVLVPYGNGYAIYRMKNGRAELRTAITAKQATTYDPD